MVNPQTFCDIRPAFCTITDRAAFLEKLRAVAADHDTHIICFNADMLAGSVHASTAVALALRAFREGENISNTLEMEALLYAAGSRQCNIAASFGIHEGENRLFVCCCPGRDEIPAAIGHLFRFTRENWNRIDQEKRTRLMKTFTISPEEVDAAGGDARMVDLVLERVALLQVLR